jgi:hypothetical protein
MSGLAKFPFRFLKWLRDEQVASATMFVKVLKSLSWASRRKLGLVDFNFTRLALLYYFIFGEGIANKEII